MNVATNVGKKFLSIIRECFPSSSPLHKIINKNTVKISYRCMPNMKTIISRHNSKVARDANPPPPIPPCKCGGNRPPCPLNGQCKTSSLVYKATVVRGDGGREETYTGLTGMEWNGIMSLDSSPLLLDGGHFLGYQKTSLVRGIKGTWI